MKFSIKFACVFIIAMFCLSPLGAIDLGQDNNTKYINQEYNKNIASKDIKILKDNETEDIGTENSTEIETEGLEDNSTAPNETDNLKNYFPYDYFGVHVDDIVEGDDAVIEVFTDDFISTGCWVFVNRQFIFLWVDHGYASTTISGLPAGTYKVELYVRDSPNDNITTFTVKPKQDPIKSINVADIHPGEQVVAEVQVDSAYTGEVSASLDNSSESKSVEIENGYGKVSFDWILRPGQHTVTVTASAVHGYKNVTKNSTFTVDTHPILNIKVNDVYEGERIRVEIETVEDYEGRATITLENGLIHTADLYEGGIQVGLSTYELKPGTHSVNVVLSDYNDYQTTNKTVTYNIKKRD